MGNAAFQAFLLVHCLLGETASQKFKSKEKYASVLSELDHIKRSLAAISSTGTIMSSGTTSCPHLQLKCACCRNAVPRRVLLRRGGDQRRPMVSNRDGYLDSRILAAEKLVGIDLDRSLRWQQQHLGEGMVLADRSSRRTNSAQQQRGREDSL